MNAKNASRRKTGTAKAAARKDIPDKSAGKSKPDGKSGKNKTGSKLKVVRDSFTMPQNDYEKIAALKLACLQAGMQVKKSELLRAGLYALEGMGIAQLKTTIAKVEQIKTGRPKKGG